MKNSSKETIQKLHGYFLLADLKCSCCDELKPEAIEKGMTLDVWKKKINEELQWIIANKHTVLLHLGALRKQWPACCNAVEELFYH